MPVLAIHIFQLLGKDEFTGESPGWYWQYKDCEKPIGPFESRRDAAIHAQESIVVPIKRPDEEA